jgi:hypothetical protein
MGRIIFVDTPAFPDPEKPGSQQQEIRKIDKVIKEWLKKRHVFKMRIRIRSLIKSFSWFQRQTCQS